MSEWRILPNEADSAMVHYAKTHSKGEKSLWHGDLIEYIKEVYNKKTFRCCVDAGASYGFLSVPFSFMFEKVYSFEPNPGVFECLSENVEGYPNIKVYSKALSNKESTQNLMVSSDISGAGRIGEFVEDSGKKFYQVQTITLDSLGLEDVDFIKIDVEQHELELLEGAIETLKKYRPVVLCEIHSFRDMGDYKRRRKIFEIFEGLGYVLHDVRYHDYLFLPL